MASSNKLNLAITVNGQEVETTLTNLNKSFYKLRNSVNKLEEGTDEWVTANKELAKVEKERERQIKVQKEFREEISRTIDAQERSADVLLDFGENMSFAFAALKAGDMVAFQAAWLKIRASIAAAGKAALAFIATPIGATLAVLAGVGLVTSKWFSYNKEIAESVKLTQQLTKFDGKELSQYRAAVQATAETFDKEFNEVLRSANSLSKQMGITQQEALGLINQGLTRGADINGDFLKKLEEYPVQFKNAGYSAQEFIDIATQEAKGGVYDDKLIDALKEADLALKEMTKTQQDALKNAFGEKFANDIAKGVSSGVMTTQEALNQIIKKSNEMGLNLQQKQQLVADIFKGAGEDAGGFAVIIEQINEAFDEENKKLNENEEATLRLVEANTEYEQALADLFDSSQSGFPAMLSNIKAITTEIITGSLVALRRMFSTIEELENQAASKGKSDAIKRIYDNATKLGTTAAEEAKIQMEATESNIERLRSKIENFPWYGLGKTKLKEELAAQESYLNELTNIAKGKSQEYTDYVNSITSVDGTGNDGLSEEEKKAQEEARKKALEERKKLLQELQKLQDDYDNRTTKRVEEGDEVSTAEREKYEALQKANRLRASLELLEQIEAEHDLKIQEAKDAKQARELEEIRAFDERKRALLDELELAKAETDEEKEEIKQEQELEKQEIDNEKETEKFEAELERLNIQGQEKADLLAQLAEMQELRLLGIKTKYLKKGKEAEQQALQAKLAALDSGLNAAISVAGEEGEVGQALLFLKRSFALAEIAINAQKAIQNIQLSAASATGNIAEGASKTASIGYPWNIIPLVGYFIQAAAIISSMTKAKSAVSKAKSAKFARGGFTDNFGQGYIDETGHEVAGVVHKNEYVVPEFVRKDPEVPQILAYLESKRKRKLGMYANGGDTVEDFSATAATSGRAADSYLVNAVDRLIAKLDEPIYAETLYGVEAEVKRQEVQKKLDQIKKDSKIKKDKQ